MPTPQYARGEEGIEALHTGQKQKADRHGIVPRFFMHRVMKPDGTLQEMECLEKIIPGDTKSIPICKVTDRERQQFPDEYEAWKKGEGFEIEGTSFELFLGRDDPRIPDLRYHKIMTVEMLAEVSDTHVQNLGLGYLELRDKARAFVAQRTGTEALSAQLKESREEMAAMQAQITELMAGKEIVTEAVMDFVTAKGTADTVPPDDVTAVEGGYVVKKGFGGKFEVLDAAKEVLHTETGPGAKTACHEWIRDQGAE